MKSTPEKKSNSLMQRFYTLLRLLIEISIEWIKYIIEVWIYRTFKSIIRGILD